MIVDSCTQFMNVIGRDREGGNQRGGERDGHTKRGVGYKRKNAKEEEIKSGERL